MTKILALQEPSWMAKKTGFDRVLETLLMETARRDMSQHFQGISPSLTSDFSKLTTLVQAALGNCQKMHFKICEHFINTSLMHY